MPSAALGRRRDNLRSYLEYRPSCPNLEMTIPGLGFDYVEKTIYYLEIWIRYPTGWIFSALDSAATDRNSAHCAQQTLHDADLPALS
jgi:hypothetical protein